MRRADSFLSAVALGLALDHEGGRRFFHSHLTKKADREKKAKRKRGQAPRRKNRRK